MRRQASAVPPKSRTVGGVHEKDLPSVVVRHDGDGARERLHDAREAVVCGLHALVRALRFGDVVERPDVAEHPSFDVKELRDAQLSVEGFAIFALGEKVDRV